MAKVKITESELVQLIKEDLHRRLEMDKYNNNEVMQSLMQMYNYVGQMGEDGLRVVQSGDKFNYLDTKSNPVFDIWFDSAGDFYKGYASVRLGKKYYWVNRKGQFVTSVKKDKDGKLKDVGDYDGIRTTGVDFYKSEKAVRPEPKPEEYSTKKKLTALSGEGSRTKRDEMVDEIYEAVLRKIKSILG